MKIINRTGFAVSYRVFEIMRLLNIGSVVVGILLNAHIYLGGNPLNMISTPFVKKRGYSLTMIPHRTYFKLSPCNEANQITDFCFFRKTFCRWALFFTIYTNIHEQNYIFCSEKEPIHTEKCLRPIVNCAFTLFINQ